MINNRVRMGGSLGGQESDREKLDGKSVLRVQKYLLERDGPST